MAQKLLLLKYVNYTLDMASFHLCYGFPQLMATIVQSLLLVNIGMELSMPTIVIGSLYQNSNAEFVLTNHESSWFGKKLNHINRTNHTLYIVYKVILYKLWYKRSRKANFFGN